MVQLWILWNDTLVRIGFFARNSFAALTRFLRANRSALVHYSTLFKAVPYQAIALHFPINATKHTLIPLIFQTLYIFLLFSQSWMFYFFNQIGKYRLNIIEIYIQCIYVHVDLLHKGFSTFISWENILGKGIFAWNDFCIVIFFDFFFLYFPQCFILCAEFILIKHSRLISFDIFKGLFKMKAQV